MRKPQRYQMKPNALVDLLHDKLGTPSVGEIKMEIIEAMQLKGNGQADMDVYRWVEDAVGGLGPIEILEQKEGVSVDPATGFMMLATSEGMVYVSPGYWVIRYPKGNFDKCEPDVFEATYDPIAE
jgi:hypothetical protein